MIRWTGLVARAIYQTGGRGAKLTWAGACYPDEADDPMRVRFSVKSSFNPSKVLWDFGDEQQSPEHAPWHSYEKSGTYEVRVALWKPNGKYHIRKVRLQMPRVRLGVQAPAG